MNRIILILVFLGFGLLKAQTFNPLAGGLDYPVMSVCEHKDGDLLALTVEGYGYNGVAKARIFKLNNNSWILYKQFDFEIPNFYYTQQNKYHNQFSFDMVYFEDKLVVGGPFNKVDDLDSVPYIINIDNDGKIERFPMNYFMGFEKNQDSFSIEFEIFSDSMFIAINTNTRNFLPVLAKYANGNTQIINSNLPATLTGILGIVNLPSYVIIPVREFNGLNSRARIWYYVKDSGVVRSLPNDIDDFTKIALSEDKTKALIVGNTFFGYINNDLSLSSAFNFTFTNQYLGRAHVNQFNGKNFIFSNTVTADSFPFYWVYDTTQTSLTAQWLFKRNFEQYAEMKTFIDSSGRLIGYSNFTSFGFLRPSYIGIYSQNLLSVGGKVYADVLNNCAFSNADIPLVNKMVYDSVSKIVSITGLNGDFSLPVSKGDNVYLIYEKLSNETQNCGHNFIRSLNNIDSTKAQNSLNFPILVSDDIGVYYAFASPRRGVGTYSQLGLFSNGIANRLNVRLVLKKAKNTDYNNFSINPTSSNDSLLVWEFDTIRSSISDFRNLIAIQFKVTADPAFYNAGDSLVQYVYIENSTDNEKSNDSFRIRSIVIGPYDPNDKTPNPYGNISPDTKKITYTIRFQNTGTAPALNVVVTDTLDPRLPLRKIKVLAVSHPQFYKLKVVDNTLIFNFTGIELPDSNSDEPNSHGFIVYEAEIKPGVAVGDTIYNTANIYFDYEDPIITNKAASPIYLSNVGVGSKISNKGLRIYPNPTNGVFVVELLSPSEKIMVYDISGREIKAYKVNGFGEVEIDLSGYSKGVYLIRNENGSSGRVIIQ